MALKEASMCVGISQKRGLVDFICLFIYFSFSFFIYLVSEAEIWVLLLFRLCSQITSHFLLLLF